MGSVAQVMAGTEFDDVIAKNIEVISSNPFGAPTADESNENLKEVHNKIQSYLGKLDKLYIPRKMTTPPSNMVRLFFIREYALSATLVRKVFDYL